ncbi:MAG: CHAT domain-containing tetratricopeptide repeat protein [Chitinophagales bacterium]
MSKDINTIPSQLSLHQAKVLLCEAKTASTEKDDDKAIELLTKVVTVFEVHEAWEEFMETSNELALVYLERSSLSDAMQIVEYALKIYQKKCSHLIEWSYHLYNRKSKILALQAKFSESIPYLLKAKEIIEQRQLSELFLIDNLIEQADYHILMRNYAQAYQLLDDAAKLLNTHQNERLLMYFYGVQASLEFYQSNYLLSKQLYDKSLEVCIRNNFEKKSYLYFRIATIHQILGNRQDSIKIYLELIEYYNIQSKDGFNNKVKRELAQVFSYMGRALMSLGDFTQALHYFERAILFYEQTGEGTNSLINLCLIDIAYIYGKQNNYAKQIEYCEKALERHQNTTENKNAYSSAIYRNLAKAYMNVNEMNKSLIYYEKALAIDIQILGKNNTLTINSYSDLGAYWTKNRRYSKGLKYLYKALKKYKNKFGHTHENIADTNAQIADNFHQQRKLKKALKHYQLALTADVPDYQETNFYHLPDVRQCIFLSGYYFLKVLAGKANALFDYALHLEKKNFSKATKALKASLNTCQLAADYLQQLHKTLKVEDSKLILGEVMPPIYQQAVKTILLLANRLAADSILEQAFTFHELANALLLRSSMQESDAKMSTSIDSDLLKQERDLRNQIEVYLQKIQKEEAKGLQKDMNKLKEWKQSHFHELLKHQALIEQFEKEYPEYYQFKYNLQTVSVATLQKDLTEDTVMISYFIGIEKGYIFAVTSDEYEIVPFEIPKDFDQQIENYLSSIHAQSISDFIPMSYNLYFLLIEPISYLIFDPFVGKPKNLVIIPSAALSYLPFETLIREIPYTAQPAFHQLDYLLQHCQIQYHYSPTLYHQSLKKKVQKKSILSSIEKSNSIDFLGFAPIYTSDKAATQEVLKGLAENYGHWATRSNALQDGTLAPLPFSEKEVQNIEGMFAEKGLKGQSYLYDAATKDHFKAIAANAKYLHIAAHGLTNDEYPKLSGIVFHPAKEATEIHDSVLSMGEMYQLQLRADLVVLSSCESGVGKLAKGEGMMAMNRGFLYAGAKNVIYTLFKVLDKPSSELCEALFEGILEGKSYAEALRLAKLTLIQRTDIDPKSWSGFVLLGA